MVIEIIIGILGLIVLYLLFQTFGSQNIMTFSPGIQVVDSSGRNIGPGDYTPLCKAMWAQSCGYSPTNVFGMGGRTLDQQCGPQWTQSIATMPPEFQRLLDDPRFCGNWVQYVPGFPYKYVFDGTSKSWVQQTISDGTTIPASYAGAYKY